MYQIIAKLARNSFIFFRHTPIWYAVTYWLYFLSPYCNYGQEEQSTHLIFLFTLMVGSCAIPAFVSIGRVP